MSDSTHILLLGAGELGTAFIPPLLALPSTYLTLAVRTPSKYAHLTASFPTLSLLPLDTTAASSTLIASFSQYDIIIAATGYGQPAGTVTKLARQVLAAGDARHGEGKRKGKLWFFPWQFGVDYDVTGDGEGLMPLFGEQLAVRTLLRNEAKEHHVKWTVVQTGIFMSFLFEPFWKVVDRESEPLTVRALRSWEHKVTVTDVGDIGKALARVVKGDVQAEDRKVFVAGDTISYAQLADIVQKVTGKEAKREEWTIPYLEEELAKDPDDLIKKYRLVFARDGVWWDKEDTVNYKLGIPMMDVETYARQLLR